MSNLGRKHWVSTWELDTRSRTIYVGVLSPEGQPRIALATGYTATPVVLSPAEAATLRDHLQSAIDERDLTAHRADQRDRAKHHALDRVRTHTESRDTKGRDAAVVDAINAGATYGEAGQAGAVTKDRIRQIWKMRTAERDAKNSEDRR